MTGALTGREAMLRTLLGALVRTYEDVWGDTDGDPLVPLSDVIRDLQAVLDGKPTQVGRVPGA